MMGKLRLLTWLLLAVVACSSGGGGGSGSTTCAVGQQACAHLEDCPPITCQCPGSTFTATIQACRSGCCPRNCDEACGSSSGPCANVTCSGHGVCSDVLGQPVCACDAGYVLAENNQCVPEGSECTSSSQCDDADPCTHDNCSNGSCTHGPTSGDACDDGNACTAEDGCFLGMCMGTFADGDGDGQSAESCGGPDCDDSDPAVWANGSESAAAGNCADGVDNDCDGALDASDPGCTSVLSQYCLASGWCWEDPLPQGDELVAVWGSGPNDVWFAGGVSIVHYDGQGLSLVDPGVPGARWTSVHGTAPNDVWFAGNAVLFHFDGTSFTDRSSEIAFDSLSSVSRVWAVSPTSVWVHAGSTGHHWNGTSWSQMSLGSAASNSAWWGSPSGTMYLVHTQSEGPTLSSWDGSGVGPITDELMPFSIYPKSIGGSGDADIWVSGSEQTTADGSGRIAQRTAGGWSYEQTLQYDASVLGVAAANAVWFAYHAGFLHYSGGTLTQVQGAAPKRPRAIWASSPSDVWAVGDAGSIQRFDGTSWSELSTRMPSTCASIWGASDGSVYCAGGKGLVGKRSAAGWGALPTGTSQDLFDLWGSSPTDVWAVGANGALVRGSGNQLSAQPVPVSSTLLSISGSSASDVWTVTHKNGVLRFDGASWSVVVPDGSVIDGNGDARIWAWPGATPTAYVSRKTLSGNFDNVVDVCSASGCGSSLTVSEQLFGIWGFGSEVWAVGDGGTGLGAVHHGPGSWTTTKLTAERFTGIGGSSPSDIWVVGSGKLFHYDGVDWTAVAGVPGSSRRLWTDGTSVFFVGGGIVRYTP